jgi:hypothetical protein
MSEPSRSNPPVPKQGEQPVISTAADRDAAIEQAFDYRGDVTLHTTDGRAIEGYIFDRRRDGAGSVVRVLQPDGQRVTVRYADVVRIAFSGRDTAEGKSWETWVKKYNEKKARGEKAELHPEPLDEG